MAANIANKLNKIGRLNLLGACPPEDWRGVIEDYFNDCEAAQTASSASVSSDPETDSDCELDNDTEAGETDNDDATEMCQATGDNSDDVDGALAPVVVVDETTFILDKASVATYTVDDNEREVEKVSGFR